MQSCECSEAFFGPSLGTPRLPNTSDENVVLTKGEYQIKTPPVVLPVHLPGPVMQFALETRAGDRLENKGSETKKGWSKCDQGCRCCDENAKSGHGQASDVGKRKTSTYPTTTIRDLRTALSGTLNEGPEYQRFVSVNIESEVARRPDGRVDDLSSTAVLLQLYHCRHPLQCRMPSPTSSITSATSEGRCCFLERLSPASGELVSLDTFLVPACFPNFSSTRLVSHHLVTTWLGGLCLRMRYLSTSCSIISIL